MPRAAVFAGPSRSTERILTPSCPPWPSCSTAWLDPTSLIPPTWPPWCSRFRTSSSERTIIGVIGDERPVDPEVFEVLAGVERVVRILKPFKLASRDFHPEDRVIDLPGGARLGGGGITVMAGPCAVESREQLE